MTIAFYEHPFSSYVQKAKTAFYEYRRMQKLISCGRSSLQQVRDRIPRSVASEGSS